MQVKRNIWTASLVLACFAGIACGPHYNTRPISLTSAESNRVERGLEAWPTPGDDAIRRPLFATIHWNGRRMTASGVLEYDGPRDFRLTAANELGAVLFDGRMSWAGVTVWRHADGLDAGVVEMLLSDLSRSLELPH